MSMVRTANPATARKREMRPRSKTKHLEFVEIDGEVVIYDETDDSLHHLNPTASIIWQSCDGTVTVGEMAAEFAEAAGLPREQIEQDVKTAIRQLADAGLMDVPKRRKDSKGKR